MPPEAMEMSGNSDRRRFGARRRLWREERFGVLFQKTGKKTGMGGKPAHFPLY